MGRTEVEVPAVFVSTVDREPGVPSSVDSTWGSVSTCRASCVQDLAGAAGVWVGPNVSVLHVARAPCLVPMDPRPKISNK